jgi:hypothetical protein
VALCALPCRGVSCGHDARLIVWRAQPWYWLPYALFDMHWEWSKYRALLNESFVLPVLARLLVLPLYARASTAGHSPRGA